jgi:hypothetical protein
MDELKRVNVRLCAPTTVSAGNRCLIARCDSEPVSKIVMGVDKGQR